LSRRLTATRLGVNAHPLVSQRRTPGVTTSHPRCGNVAPLVVQRRTPGGTTSHAWCAGARMLLQTLHFGLSSRLPLTAISVQDCSLERRRLPPAPCPARSHRNLRSRCGGQ
jgi:hypothetical protein